MHNHDMECSSVRKKQKVLLPTKFKQAKYLTYIALMVILLLSFGFNIASYLGTKNSLIKGHEDQSADLATFLNYQVHDIFSEELSFSQLIRDEKAIDFLDSHLYDLMAAYKIEKVKIYDLQGQIVYCTEKKFTGLFDKENKKLQKTIQNRKVLSYIESAHDESDLPGEGGHQDLLETYVPIFSPYNEQLLIGVIEIYQDLSYVYQAMTEARNIFLLVSFLATSGIILAFLLFVGKAETLTSREYLMVKTLNNQLQQTYIDTVKALAAALEAKDPYTRGHSQRVATFSMMIGKAIGLEKTRMERLEQAAYLHDIGKIGMKYDVLNKPAKLSEEEWQMVKAHPAEGASMLSMAASLEPLVDIVMHHHERYDGKGYPAGLKGREIPLEARIIALADSYDAMNSDRPYRSRLSEREIIEQIRKNAGLQFDPEVAKAFLKILEPETLSPERKLVPLPTTE